jgi:hypothetical protein
VAPAPCSIRPAPSSACTSNGCLRPIAALRPRRPRRGDAKSPNERGEPFTEPPQHRLDPPTESRSALQKGRRAQRGQRAEGGEWNVRAEFSRR